MGTIYVVGQDGIILKSSNDAASFGALGTVDFTASETTSKC